MKNKHRIVFLKGLARYSLEQSVACGISGTKCYHDKELISLIGIIDSLDQVRKTKIFSRIKSSIEYSQFQAKKEDVLETIL